MDIGVSMFFTDYSMGAGALGQAAEARGFESLWAPEHSHIPVNRQTEFPGGGAIPKKYYDAMDPFVSLSIAAAMTSRIKLVTGVCLVIQRDPIQTAKLVASLDQVSGGRFVFGIGGGWLAEEIENHGTAFKTRFAVMRERIEAMVAIWTQSKAEYHGKYVDFDPIMAWPKPVQKPHPPILVGGVFPQAARRAIAYGNGWCPLAGRAGAGELADMIGGFRAMATEAGRDPASLPITLFAAPENPDMLKRYRDMGVARVVVSLESEPAETILPVLDRWAGMIEGLQA
ncbi:MAG: LLM class F420-dependent oxidoreductase [Rhodospirillales bacterium]|nr:LLM class F420-dependent oxidoreductase [Rhodospirillales bacterium]